jgi:hypothetical protein
MAKTTTNMLKSVDIHGLRGNQVVINGHFYRVNVTETPCCHYGGSRKWFSCPYCKSRVGVLYLGNSGLACRKCYRLAYPTESLTRRDRAMQQAYKANRRLGGCDNDTYADSHVDKPKGMHWKTYNKLLAKRQNYSDIFWGNVVLFMGRMFLSK